MEIVFSSYASCEKDIVEISNAIDANFLSFVFVAGKRFADVGSKNKNDLIEYLEECIGRRYVPWVYVVSRGALPDSKKV